MANITSSKKRIKVSARKKEENRGKKSELATMIKKFRAMVAKNELKEAEAFLPEVVRLIDSSASHNRLHKNNASRKQARLAALLDKAKKAPVVAQEVVAPVVEVKKEAVKVEVKKEEVKVEAPVKKEATKKTTATKKPAAKVEEVVAEEKPAKKTTTKKATTKKEA